MASHNQHEEEREREDCHKGDDRSRVGAFEPSGTQYSSPWIAPFWVPTEIGTSQSKTSVRLLLFVTIGGVDRTHVMDAMVVPFEFDRCDRSPPTSGGELAFALAGTLTFA